MINSWRFVLFQLVETTALHNDLESRAKVNKQCLWNWQAQWDTLLESSQGSGGDGRALESHYGILNAEKTTKNNMKGDNYNSIN